MDMDKIKKARDEQDMSQKAIGMMLSILETMVPDDMQPIFQLPKLCNNIDQKKSTILRLVSDAFGSENSVKLASEANVLLARIDEDLEAFIEQHIEGVNI